jgi:hypothetical protein
MHRPDRSTCDRRLLLGTVSTGPRPRVAVLVLAIICVLTLGIATVHSLSAGPWFPP